LNEQLDGGAVNQIERLTLAGQLAQTPVEIHGDKYTAQTLHRVKQFHAWPETQSFQTLKAIVEFLALKSKDEQAQKGLYLHVLDYNKVELTGPVESEDLRSPTYAVTVCPLGNDFRFDSFMPVEEMVIKVRTLFSPNEDLDKLVSMLVNVDSTETVKQKDDGIQQSVTIKKGGSSVEREFATNQGIFQLQPYRTFQEIAQPVGEFLFRIKTDPERGASAAIFTAGGNAWKLDAIEKIKAYLVGQGITVPVIG